MYLEYDLRFGREGQPGFYAQVAVAAIANWFRFAKAELSSTLIMFARWKHGTLPKDLPKERVPAFDFRRPLRRPSVCKDNGPCIQGSPPSLLLLQPGQRV